ncbi:hypothetical protein LIER_31726 [Lithospermum erythrorhizon]|uniref:Reverse transcriptase domain-containing protein n=1 Tax=Lithospermum erythrorhizon TaxID=34254 RepID=A0AAV3RRX8_LITER
MVMGDFNTVAAPTEQLGCKPQRGRNDFVECIDHCKLEDAGYIGILPGQVQNMWIKHDNFMNVVTNNWRLPMGGDAMSILWHKLKRLKGCLKQWNKEEFGNIFSVVAQAEDQVLHCEQVLENSNTPADIEAFNNARANHLRCLALEEEYWSQLSVVDFYKELFQGESQDTEVDILEDCIPKLVTDSDNVTFLSTPSWEEVKNVVFSLDKKSVQGNRLPQDITSTVPFDKVSWSFLKSVLTKFGFSPAWITMIMQCIDNSWFSIMLNGELHSYFPSTKGVRQGDPLSPALFILAEEYLLRGLQKLTEENPEIKYQTGCSVTVPCLALADDCIFFCNGSLSSVKKLMGWLHHCQQVSGQVINTEKSTYITSNKLSATRANMVVRATGFRREKMPFIYLWILILCSPLCQYMQSMKLPSTVINKMEKIFNDFLWNGKPWATWNKAYAPVAEGGLNMRGLEDLNHAFLCMAWYRFRTGASLWSRFMQAKYCRLHHPLMIVPHSSHSRILKCLLRARDQVEYNVLWLLGEGKCAFWLDTWREAWPPPPLSIVLVQERLKVCDLWTNGAWDQDKLRALVFEKQVQSILQTHIHHGSGDTLVWKTTTNGDFSLADAYEEVRVCNDISAVFSSIWHTIIPKKMSFMVWRLHRKQLPVDAILKRKGVQLAAKCVLCT